MDSKTVNDELVCKPRISAIKRRRVISAAGMGWLALAGSAVLTALGLQRFLYPNVGKHRNQRVNIGNLANLSAMPPSSVKEDYKKLGFYVARYCNGIAALSTACTHLGCTLNWIDSDRKFKCPCHGSGFSQLGFNLEGPAPRPMERFKIVVEEGSVIVDCSQVYRQEKGEWSDPESFIRI